MKTRLLEENQENRNREVIVKRRSCVGMTWRFRVCNKGMKEEDKPEFGPEHPNLLVGALMGSLVTTVPFSNFFSTASVAEPVILKSGTGTTPNAATLDGTYQQSGTTVTRATGTGTFVGGNVGDFVKFGTGETAKILSVTSTVEVVVNKSQTVAATTLAVFDTSRIALDSESDSNNTGHGPFTVDAYDAPTGTTVFRRSLVSAGAVAPVSYTEFGWTSDAFDGVGLASRIVLDEAVNLEVDQYLEAQVAMRVVTENFRTEAALTLDITGWPYPYAIQSITSDGANWDVVVSPDCNAHFLVGGAINIAGALPATAAITGITSTGSDFTVTAPGHGLSVGNSIEIEGASPGGYDGTWTVDSVDGDDVTILDAANLGVGSGGTIRKSTPGTWYDGAHTIASFPAANTIRITNATSIIDAGEGGTVKNNLTATGIITGKGVMDQVSSVTNRRGLLDFGPAGPTESSVRGIRMYRAANLKTGMVHGVDHSTTGAVTGLLLPTSAAYNADTMIETLTWLIPTATWNFQDIRQMEIYCSIPAGSGSFWITFAQPQRKDAGFQLTVAWQHYWEPELNDLEIG
jgi:hypothetical protein